MSNSNKKRRFVAIKTRGQRVVKFTIALMLLAFLVNVPGVRAEGPDEDYLRIFNMIQQADSISAKGQSETAQAKYREAQTALQNLHRTYPNWNAQMVAYRLNYLAGKL